MSSGKLYTVGRIVNTHGIRGEVKVLLQTDFAKQRFAVGNTLYMTNEQGDSSHEVKIVASREQKNVYILKLEGFQSINEVEKYKGWYLKIAEEAQEELEDGQYYYHQILGCTVETEEGATLGVISEILSPGANDVWVVDRPRGLGDSLLLPVIDEVVIDVDVRAKLVKVRLMEGLI